MNTILLVVFAIQTILFTSNCKFLVGTKEQSSPRLKQARAFFVGNIPDDYSITYGSIYPDNSKLTHNHKERQNEAFEYLGTILIFNNVSKQKPSNQKDVLIIICFGVLLVSLFGYWAVYQFPRNQKVRSVKVND